MTEQEAYLLVLSYLEDEAIDRWHNDTDPKSVELPEWMGLTEEEYALWAQCDWITLAESLVTKPEQGWRRLGGPMEVKDG